MSERENERAAFEKHASGCVSSYENGVEQCSCSDYLPHAIEEDADDEVFSICSSIFIFHFPTLFSLRCFM